MDLYRRLRSLVDRWSSVEKMGGKGSRKLLMCLLFLPLIYIVCLRVSISPRPLWRIQLTHWPTSLSLRGDSSGINGGVYMRFLLRRLVRGKARRELSQNGISCVSDPHSNFCVTSDAVRITTGPSRSPTVYLSAGQRLRSGASTFTIQPYPRKTDEQAMQRTAPVNIVPAGWTLPACDVNHDVPAVVFSTGGFAGNFYHDVDEVLIPLFLTAAHFRSSVQLVVTDYEPWWVSKYRRYLAHLSPRGVVVGSSSSAAVDRTVHCFPGAVVGVKIHGIFRCNSSDAPGGASTLDFKRFLHSSLSLKAKEVPPVAAEEKPLLVLLSRRRNRVVLNENDVVRAAEEAGFRVEVALPERLANLEDFTGVVNGCSVLMGVHGAGLTNMVFLPAGAVVMQVVPWGLDWASWTYYGRVAVEGFGLRYVEHKTTAEESTLYDKYPKDHQVIADPWAVHRQGYGVAKPIYTEGQNLTVDVGRLRGSLMKAMELLPKRPPLPSQ